MFKDREAIAGVSTRCLFFDWELDAVVKTRRRDSIVDCQVSSTGAKNVNDNNCLEQA